MASQSVDQRVAARVRQVLAARATSQRALGVRLGQSQGWVSRRLRGVPGFSIAELTQIASVLGVPLEFFTDHLQMDELELRPVGPS